MDMGTRFVIVSRSINEEGALRYGRRDKGVEKADSGGQFSTAINGTNVVEKAEVWSLNELFDYDKTIIDFIDAPVRSVARRRLITEPWTVEID